MGLKTICFQAEKSSEANPFIRYTSNIRTMDIFTFKLRLSRLTSDRLKRLGLEELIGANTARFILVERTGNVTY